jgi:hypothetical protein
MARLSVTTAWNETVAFVKAEARLLFPLSFMLIALPAAVVRALVPVTPGEELRPGAPLMALVAAAIVLALIGNLSITCLAVRAGASVREAIVQGARRAPVLAAAAFLVGCGFMALAFVLLFIVSLAVVGTSGGQPGTQEMATAARIMIVLFAPILLYLSGRVALMPPAAAAEPGGPFAIIARSWRLTAPHQFKMAGFVALLFILTFVLQLAAESVLGILLIALAGAAGPGSVSAILILLVMAALNTVLAVYGATLVARVYVQLAADRPAKAR